MLYFVVGSHFLYVWTLAVVVLLGLGDETIQSMLPTRYFGLVDMVVNTAAGLFTLAFIGFVLGKKLPLGTTAFENLTYRLCVCRWGYIAILME